MKRLGSTLNCFEPPILTAEQWADQNSRVAQWEIEQARIAYSERIKRAEIPKLYASATSEAIDPQLRAIVEEYARDVAKGGNGWLDIMGPSGTGKTSAAVVALRFIAHHRSCVFATMQGILTACKDTFGTGETESAAKARFFRAPVLLLDDFGKEQATDWSLPVVFELFEARQGKATIVTRNLNGSQLVTHLTSRGGDADVARAVASRLLPARHVAVMGSDRRAAS